ncbi:hypothetical protein OHW67_07585 [Acinetobacter baumannii]|nr:hypothetical protein [Acinetobacter baumannii]
MSVVIKSDNIANNYFGTSKMLGTTPEIEFQTYKSRVLADGGVIKDEERTLRAFKLLFNAKMYGNMNTAVSGTFGVKLNSSGGIQKLYSLDGYDLIGVVYGNGTLPTLDSSNNISFAANDPAQNTDGAIFTTASKVVASKVGNFGYATCIKDFGDTSNNRRLAGLTKHMDVPNTVIIAQLVTTAGGEVHLNMHADPLSLTSAANSSEVRVNVSSYNYPMISFLTVPELSQKFGSRSGSEITMPTGKTFMEITTEDFYIDFGGTIHSNVKYFSKATVKDFMCFNQATREQSTLLSTFI